MRRYPQIKKLSFISVTSNFKELFLLKFDLSQAKLIEIKSVSLNRFITKKKTKKTRGAQKCPNSVLN